MGFFSTIGSRIWRDLTTPNVYTPTKKSTIEDVQNNINYLRRQGVFGAAGYCDGYSGYEVQNSGICEFYIQKAFDGSELATGQVHRLIDVSDYERTNVHTGTDNGLKYRVWNAGLYWIYGDSGDSINFLPGGSSSSHITDGSGVSNGASVFGYTSGGHADGSGGSAPNHVKEIKHDLSSYGTYKYRFFVDSSTGDFKVRIQEWGTGAFPSVKENVALFMFIRFSPPTKID